MLLFISLLQSYSGAALANRLAAVPIDAAAVESAMVSTQPTTSDPVAAGSASTYYGWVAGPVIGGIAFFALLGAGYWWLHQRHAGQGVQAKSRYMDTMAEARTDLDGATPREGGSSTGVPRAQATLN